MTLESSLVSVVIVSCGKDDLLTRCLQSVQGQRYGSLEYFVFLNKTSQQEAARWAKDYPGVRFKNFVSNELYCKPLNQGIQESSGAFVLCLNDDVVLEPDFIEKIVPVFKSDLRVGAASGRVMRDDGKTIDTLGLSWSRARKPVDIGYGRFLDFTADIKAGDIFGVNGAVAFYRRSMLEDIKMDEGYFDEDYGIYYEDFDVAWRAQRAGWKARYCPCAIATHKRGATTRNQNKQLKFLDKFAFTHISEDLKMRHMRNRYSTLIKNDSFLLFLRDLPWIIFYEIRLFAYLIFFDRGILIKFLKDFSFVSSSFLKRRKILKRVKHE
jgi:GT2 family glycosyltransferase